MALAVAWLSGVGAQAEPTLTITPSSGPCDATLRVTGTGLTPPTDPTDRLGIYLVGPGTTDVSMSILNGASVEPDGTFEQFAPLHESGCGAAALDATSPQPSGHLLLAVNSVTGVGEPPAGDPGDIIPNIVATAQYGYTTIAPHIPTEAMVITPASGPCDGTVQITGQGFPPSTAIRLDMGVPKGDGTMGRLASLMTDSSGQFSVTVGLTSLGCEAARLDDHYSGQLWIFADLEERTIVPGQGIPPILMRSPYKYTTAWVGAQGEPSSLPLTGDGPPPPGIPGPHLVLLLGLALGGILTLAVGLAWMREPP